MNLPYVAVPRGRNAIDLMDFIETHNGVLRVRVESHGPWRGCSSRSQQKARRSVKRRYGFADNALGSRDALATHKALTKRQCRQLPRSSQSHQTARNEHRHICHELRVTGQCANLDNCAGLMRVCAHVAQYSY